jgi:hypothetical protein
METHKHAFLRELYWKCPNICRDKLEMVLKDLEGTLSSTHWEIPTLYIRPYQKCCKGSGENAQRKVLIGWVKREKNLQENAASQ